MALKTAIDRRRVAQKIAAAKYSIAQAVSDQFYLEHPDWMVRWGERGGQFSPEDARTHLEFLCGALEVGSPESFADYALWNARMMAAKGVPNDPFTENFNQVSRQLSRVLTADEYLEVSAFLVRGMSIRLEPQVTGEAPQPESDLRLTQGVYLAAILKGERHTALKIVEETLRNGVSHVDIYVDILAETLHQVGELWEKNKITMAQEHMATVITQYAIATVYPRIVSSGPRRGRMVVTGVSGELHQIGANLVADAMESRGWNVHFLGTNLMHGSIVEKIEESSADVLCISTTIVANLPATAELIRLVRTRLGDAAPNIVLGGAAYRLVPHFAEDLGLSSPPADLRTALALLCG